MPTILNLPVDDLGGIGGTYANGQDINSKGDTVGIATSASGGYHAFYRPAAGPMAAKTANRPTSAALMRMTFPPNDLKLPKGTLA
jgi:hypothetical protein